VSQIQLWENIWNDEFVKSLPDVRPLGDRHAAARGRIFPHITRTDVGQQLFNDTMTVGGREAKLADIKVRPARGRRARPHRAYKREAPDYEDRLAGQGRGDAQGRSVSLVAGANAIKRLWPKLDSWLGGRSI